MPNCMTCRHNDRAAKYCSLKRAHTDLGYVLNCVAWAPTDETEMRRLRDENRRLRELAKKLFKLADRGLMELGDDDFRRIVDEAEKLGVTDG